MKEVLDALDRWMSRSPSIRELRLAYRFGDTRVTIEVQRDALSGSTPR